MSRHSGVATASLMIEHLRDRVEIRVTNLVASTVGEGDRRTAPSTGVGIIGMTERAEALGGSLTARPEGDQFRVDATIPYHATTTLPAG